MANDEHVEILKEGPAAWNKWRSESPPDGQLIHRVSNLGGTSPRAAILRVADLSGANLGRASLNGMNLVGADLNGANLSRTFLQEADLWGASLVMANLSGAHLVRADLNGANLSGAQLVVADLNGANLSKTNLSGANLQGANLQSATLVETDFTNAVLTGCRIYGVSAWRLQLEGAKQQDLIVTPDNEPKITVDNIEVAQFINLLLHNQKIRDVINTITSKTVLILGRFAADRKAVLDALREELRKRNLLPILFDFAIPASRDVTETIKTLASLARFVIADVTDATEVRAELHNIVSDFPSLPIQPILLRGHPEFVSQPHLQRFPWFLPTFEYEDPGHLLASLDIVADAEAKVSAVEEALKEARRKIEAELSKTR